MDHLYQPSSIEAKWQQKWAEAKAFTIDLKKTKAEDKYYTMVMFPYPSGDKLHVGHWYNFAPADSFARYMRMKGKTVFTPMGFDAFGLPAENYAIKTGVPPAQSITTNVETMIKQLSRIGTMYDWSKMVNTSTPEYYKWTQWLFLQMFKHDLAYKKEANVNWCPKDQTVLANEQVKEGVCERCGTAVVQKSLNQWFWKTTKYAQKLIDNLDDLDWPEKTKLMQKNWIGRSEGAEIHFEIDGHDKAITVFTTRPDTLFGVTYVVLAPENPLVDEITPKDHKGVVDAYRTDVKKKTEMQRTDLNKVKTGVPTGAFALHPVTKEKLPIWIADYVLMNYGTGAVMAVPGHDERDWDFAKAMNLPMIEVVEGGTIDEAAFTGEGVAVNSQFLDGLQTPDAKKKMIAWLEDAEKGRGVINYRLRDWTVSRQRYWGAPIPIVYDPQGNAHPVPEEHLPWVLPTDVEFKPTGESPLTHSKEFIERTEKIFGEGWRPEFDTMDTFVCSSFYYLRYLAEGDQKHIVDPHVDKNWMPVDMYIGGPEHATMHLIYARFVTMALKDMGFIAHDEPFKRLVHQGLITNQGAKMSKSKGNVVSPDSFVERYGSDVFRMYLMFMGPFTDGGDWNDTGIKGIDRFVQKVYKTLTEKILDADSPEVTRALHYAIKRVTDSLEKLQFNTAISALMECLNTIEASGGCSADSAKIYATLLLPLAPHLAEELWEVLGGTGMIIDQKWPSYDPKLLVRDTLTIAVQVNGKLRGTINVPADMSKDDVIVAAKNEENTKKYLEGVTIKKEIYVAGKLVSFVI
jgi:leucyl-tRNA synthetase